MPPIVEALIPLEVFGFMNYLKVRSPQLGFASEDSSPIPPNDDELLGLQSVHTLLQTRIRQRHMT